MFEHSPATYAALFFAASAFLITCNSLFERFRLPQAAIVIVLGMLLGPLGFNIIEYGEIEKIASEVAVILILFSAGHDINWSLFLSALKPGLLVGLTGIIASIFLGFIASFTLTDRIEEALYVGIALSATSVGLSVSILSRSNALESKVGQILLAAAIVDDILVLYLLSAAHVSLTTSNGIGQIGYSLVVSLLVLTVLCILIWLVKLALFRTVLARIFYLRRLVLVAVGLLCAWITQRVGLSPLVGGFAAGAVFSIQARNSITLDADFFNRLSKVFAPLFFLSVGMQITEISFKETDIIWYFLWILIASVLGKLLSPWIISSVLSLKERYLLGVALLPRAEVALIVATVGLQQQHITHHTMVALVLMALTTTVLSSFFIPLLAKNVGLHSQRG